MSPYAAASSRASSVSNSRAARSASVWALSLGPAKTYVLWMWP